MTTLQAFADLLFKEQSERLQREHKFLDPEKECKVMIKPGKKWIKVDVGTSGKFMVDAATGDIFGIKAYGVVHKGHHYGNLNTIDRYDWGGYYPCLKLA